MCNKELISKYLNDDIKIDIKTYDLINSTSELAKEIGKSGDFSTTLILANEQSNGKGRMGKTFYSPKNTGIYMSILFKPNLKMEESMKVTTATAVAVTRAIKKLFDVNPMIKWVNDILIDKKKVAGILLESEYDFSNASFKYMVVGIGINLATNEFPENIKNSATSLLYNFDTKDKNKLIAAVVNEFFNIINNIGTVPFIEEYKNYSAVLNQNIRILNHKEENAYCLDIDDNGGLVVRLENGDITTITSGEVSIRGDFYNA